MTLRIVFARDEILPTPAERGWGDPPPGHRHEWAADTLGTEMVREGDERPCRARLAGPSHNYCGQPSVISVERGVFQRQRWHYCAEHSYGRIVVDGIVLMPRAVPIERKFSGR